MITVKTHIEISAPIQVCFDLARDIDIHTKTVWKHTKEKAIMGAASEPIGLGQTVTFEATHFLVRQRLSSKITEYQEPFLFVDEMQKGAFKSLRHVHEFKQLVGKTLMTDTLYFEAPFGMIGKAVERLILKKYMQKFLEHRNQQLKILIEER
ncbi:Ligand-binding SRPBCC domain-containing protein [Paenibacillus algorifonticola]|uniref:Ligand-binding SRPBCC domain-containing protein n=1 Tax=Paenibacillus algorifonticola TaxID=684063 RepID=A0A1I2GLA6_9BACL|nr:SRPBCC family protein [Paenibacillus algorifonticola]SFF17516.1 Ligand-binding SRPBCC domain-containing protein [Paenibacillus algorifonticola]